MGLFDTFRKRKEKSTASRLAFTELKDASQVNRDYYVMTALSAAIATLGLFLNSAAVIIGAMLIAPLMSPILACGLAVARGDLDFLKRAAQTSLVGIIVAAAVAATLGALVPRMPLGTEVLARTHPTVFDLGVALASGVAGAYAFSSRSLSAMLPGVAIAAALIPPLATLGIGFSFGRRDVLFGAALLFLANFVAIAVGAALTFLALGFIPEGTGPDHRHRKRSFIVAAVLMALILIPLVYFTVQNISTAQRQADVGEVVGRYLPARDGYSVREATAITDNGRVVVSVIVMGEAEPDPERLRLLKSDLRASFHRDVTLDFNFIPYKKSRY